MIGETGGGGRGSGDGNRARGRLSTECHRESIGRARAGWAAVGGRGRRRAAALRGAENVRRSRRLHCVPAPSRIRGARPAATARSAAQRTKSANRLAITTVIASRMAPWEPDPRGPEFGAIVCIRVPFSTQHASSDASGVPAAPRTSPERLAAVKRPPQGRPNRAPAHLRTGRRAGPARCWRSVTRSMAHAPPRSFEDRVAAYGTDPISGSGAQDKMPCARKWMHSGNNAARVWHLPPLPEAARNAHTHACPRSIPALALPRQPARRHHPVQAQQCLTARGTGHVRLPTGHRDVPKTKKSAVIPQTPNPAHPSVQRRSRHG